MADNIDQEIADALAKWRPTQFPSQAAIARKMRISPARYGNWERGTAGIPRKYMAQLKLLGFIPPGEPNPAIEGVAPYYTRTTPTQLKMLVETIYRSNEDTDLRAEARRELYRLLQLPDNEPQKVS